MTVNKGDAGCIFDATNVTSNRLSDRPWGEAHAPNAAIWMSRLVPRAFANRPSVRTSPFSVKRFKCAGETLPTFLTLTFSFSLSSNPMVFSIRV
jgi:hypothetical protein